MLTYKRKTLFLFGRCNGFGENTFGAFLTKFKKYTSSVFGEAAFNYAALSTVFLKKNIFFFYYFFIKRDDVFRFFFTSLCNIEIEGIAAQAERLLNWPRQMI